MFLFLPFMFFFYKIREQDCRKDFAGERGGWHWLGGGWGEVAGYVNASKYF
jgi:hypothetical protein